MIIDRTNGKLEEARESEAYKVKGESLDRMLKYLGTYACPEDDPEHSRCLLFPDFAPLSFAFTIEVRDKEGEYQPWFNGGLIYHGPHDGHGSGSAPTFSVTLDKADGWRVHT